MNDAASTAQVRVADLDVGKPLHDFIIDEALRSLIHKGAGELEMLEHARTSSNSIRNDGMKRVLAGDTTIDEIIRVTQEG